MNQNILTDRDRRLQLEIEGMRRCDDPEIDGPEAQVSALLTGLRNMKERILAKPQDIDLDQALLLDIEKLRRCDNPTVDSPEAQISLLLSGLSGLSTRIDVASQRLAIARIVDDEIWDSDSDYPLDRRRIKDRRKKAYAKADAILSLMRGE